MSQQENDSEKPYEPTARRLQKAREKGDIVRSADLFAAAAYTGLALAALFFGAASIMTLGDALVVLVGHPDRLMAPFMADGEHGVIRDLVQTAVVAVLPWFLGPFIAVTLMVVAQRAMLFTPSKLAPKPSRISPLSNAKNKYGRGGLFEFFKSFVKLIIYSVALALYLGSRMNQLAASLTLEPAISIVMLGQMALEFLFLVIVIAACIGGVDYFWQRAEHMRKNRMSHKELQDEVKESEGDPHMKQQRRQKAQEVAMRQMMGDVPGADVVIVNPTHYAVALVWNRMPGAAPECVAKGQDEIALRIRAVAQEHEVPVHSDPPTARALFATVDIGQEIDAEHYRNVAAAIRFAEDMRRRARARK